MSIRLPFLFYVRVAPVAVAVAMLAGCDAAEVDGTIVGQSLEAEDAVSTVFSSEWGSEAGIVIINQPSFCDGMGQLYDSPVRFLFIALAQFEPATKLWKAPTEPGTHVVHMVSQEATPRAALVLYFGSEGASSIGRSGSVELTSASADGTFEGEGDVTMDSGDHITFEFDTSSCARLPHFNTIVPPPPFFPRTAWALNVVQSQECKSSGERIGQIDAAQVSDKMVDGLGSVSCTVAGTDSFAVKGRATTTQGLTLSVDIPAITPQATKENPAEGVVTFPSLNVGLDRSGTCFFYFVPGTGETVHSGNIWAAFTCPGLGDGVSTCDVEESYVLFENCTTSGN
jgi:hypothetical protein